MGYGLSPAGIADAHTVLLGPRDTVNDPRLHFPSIYELYIRYIIRHVVWYL